MNISGRVMLMWLILVAVFFSGGACAEGWMTQNGTGKITIFNNEQHAVRLYFNATDLSNPDNCGNTSAVILKADTAYQQYQYSALLAAFYSNKPVKLYVSGCYAAWGTSWPILTASYILP